MDAATASATGNGNGEGNGESDGKGKGNDNDNGEELSDDDYHALLLACPRHKAIGAMDLRRDAATASSSSTAKGKRKSSSSSSGPSSSSFMYVQTQRFQSPCAIAGPPRDAAPPRDAHLVDAYSHTGDRLTRQECCKTSIDLGEQVPTAKR